MCLNVKRLFFSLVEVRGVNFPDDGDHAGVELCGELGLGDDGRDAPDLLLGHAVVAVLVIQPEDYLREGKCLLKCLR